ncbi:MAG: wzb, partial [Candidatus Adlerbacteria bacterium]|nr:wzb [Candidatus Adlerbacteria bacterium]
MNSSGITKRVLVVGESSRSTLAVIRSLGRAGIEVDLATSDPHAPVVASRYVRNTIVLPRVSAGIPQWVAALYAAAEQKKYDLLIPTTEGVFVPCIENRDIFSRVVKCALPSSEAFAVTHNKASTSSLARKLGISTPLTTIIESESDIDLALQSAEFPVAIKPSHSRVIVDGIPVGLSVSIVHSIEAARNEILAKLPFGSVLVQEYWPGRGVGQEFICKEGHVLAQFQHNRIREQVGSGGSTYRVSAPMHAGMLEASRKILAELVWDGVVMVEYRFDEQTGEFVLLEINGRLWGSLPLAVAAGADFPLWIYNLFVLGSYPQYISGKKTYRKNLYGRDLFADISLCMRQGLWRGIACSFQSAVGLLVGKETWDSFSLDDMVPWIRECS